MLLPGTSTLPEAVFESVDNDPWLSLVIAMMHEYALGDHSRWSPYFAVLPSHFDTPMFWNDDELAELQASSVTKRLGKEEAEVTFREKVLPMVKKRLPTSSFFTDDAEIISIAHRMASTIMAYAFDIEPSHSQQTADEEGYVSDEDEDALPKGMVPLADMLNADGARNNARLFYEDDNLVMKSIKPITAGEEIFNDFGDLPSSDLLRRYGYVTSNYREYDVVEIPSYLMYEKWEDLGLTEKQMEERMGLLNVHGLLDTGYDLSHPSSEATNGSQIFLSMASPEFRTALSTLMLSVDEFESLRSRNRLPNPLEEVPFVENVPLTLCEVLLAAVRSTKNEYQTSLAEDCQLSEDGVFKDSTRKSMALQVRIGEKEILREAEIALEKAIRRHVVRERLQNHQLREAVVDALSSSKRRKLG